MVPLDRRHTVLDWIAALEVPALLVTGSYLGTLSHTLTAVGMLQARNVKLAGIVVNESEEQPVAPEETVQVLARFAVDIPDPFGGAPRYARPRPGSAAPAQAPAQAVPAARAKRNG